MLRVFTSLLFLIAFASADQKQSKTRNPNTTKSSEKKKTTRPQPKSQAKPQFKASPRGAGRVLGLAEAEKIALGFVKKNHPELGELLTELKRAKPEHYERAVRELAKTSARLKDVQERDVARYKLELSAWRNQSRIQVLGAQYLMTRDEKLKGELQAALREQYDIKIAQQVMLRERTEKRLQQLDDGIAKMKVLRDADAEKRFERFIRTLTYNRPKRDNTRPTKTSARVPAKQSTSRKTTKDN